MLILVVFRDSGWPWAARVAGDLDVGFSAGAFAAAAATSAVVRSPWRLRMRAALVIYVVLAFILVGTLADLLHLVAVAIGLPAGRPLTRGLGTAHHGHPSRREWRLLAVAGIVLNIAADVVLWLAPGDGPLGSTRDENLTWVDVAITLVVGLLLVNGLRKGSRVGVAVGDRGLNVAVGVVVGVLVARGRVRSSLSSGRPLFVFGQLVWPALLAVLIIGRRAFTVPSRRRLRGGVTGTTDREAATKLLERHGGGTLSWMATWPANSYFLTPGEETVIAYQPHAGVGIALGDPIGPAEESDAAVAEFAKMCERSRMVPCMFSVTARSPRPRTGWAGGTCRWRRTRWWTCPTWSSRASRGRTCAPRSTGRARTASPSGSVTLAEEKRTVIAQVRAISEEWVGDKGLPEMGFTLGGVDEALDPAVRVGLAEDADGHLHGVTSWLPIYAGDDRVRGWTLDLMRRRDGGFRGVVEYLIASTCMAFRSEGAEVVSLSGAPLARGDDADPTGGLERVLDTLGAVMEPLYGFRSLHAFKTKFQPRYETMHLVYRDEADLPRIGVALTRAYLPDAPVRELVKIGAGRAV